MLPLRPDGPKAASQATAATASSAPPARRVVSQVPLPSYAQPSPVPAPTRGGGLSSRLMSLNSAILAAQQEWERKNRGDGRSLSGSSSVSSSGVSSVTNESGPEPTRGDFILRYYENVDGVEDHDDDYGAYALRGAELELALQRQSARAVQAVIDAGRAAELKMPSPSAPAGRSHDLPAEQESSEDSSSAYDDDGFLYGQSRTYGDRASAGDAPRRVTVAELAEAYSFADPDRRSRSATTLRKTKQSTPPEPTTRPKNSVQAPLPQLEMESWEVAPGRMVDSTHGENIGYSNAYLNGREPVQVSEDVSFNVLTIKPGDKARWEAHESQLRTCSVASGKIEIKIGANKFGTGPNSVFIIRPGETCVATNKLYVDATVHCTTVKNYSLLT
ncbi:hypothetical protein IF1G_06706 [Cordyceps javanica]|uniref:Cupin, RmlC-type n=1 Tax=Cordyceps javanica TaxID=43265 RepID=A0A545UYY5_9HYPO|nr:hypothetical protein IF1G_06706 [Cordyceps javanica]TQW06570.1 hypothetical protein IF2G_05992 [Cordyceps javanica]